MCFIFYCGYNLLMFVKQLNNIITEQEMDSLYQSYIDLFHEYIPKEMHENFLKKCMEIYDDNKLMSLNEMINYFAIRGIKILKKHDKQWNQLVTHYERGFVNYGVMLLNDEKFNLKNVTIEKLKLNYFEDTPHEDGNGGFTLVTETFRKYYQSPLHFAWQILIYHRNIDNPIEINEIFYFTNYHLVNSDQLPLEKPFQKVVKNLKKEKYTIYCIYKEYDELCYVFQTEDKYIFLDLVYPN